VLLLLLLLLLLLQQTLRIHYEFNLYALDRGVVAVSQYWCRVFVETFPLSKLCHFVTCFGGNIRYNSSVELAISFFPPISDHQLASWLQSAEPSTKPAAIDAINFTSKNSSRTTLMVAHSLLRDDHYGLLSQETAIFMPRAAANMGDNLWWQKPLKNPASSPHLSPQLTQRHHSLSIIHPHCLDKFTAHEKAGITAALLVTSDDVIRTNSHRLQATTSVLQAAY
jgi:hypothetical protein